MPSMVKNEASTVYVNSSFQATALLGYSKAMKLWKIYLTPKFSMIPSKLSNSDDSNGFS